MAEGTDSRKWDELIPDTLGLIFKNLSLHEQLTVVPCVCKSWERAVTGPYCWQEIDIEEWSKMAEPESVDRMLRLLIARSSGSLRKLAVTCLASEEIFMFITNHAPNLRTLIIPRSEINDPIMQTVAEKLSYITSLDVSYCLNIGPQSLESIGTNCKSLTTLRRVMHPLEVVNKPSQNEEALAIAKSMPKLKHLEIAYLLVDTPSVIEIIDKCKLLELLDLRGCWEVNLDPAYVKGFPKLKVVGPLVTDCHYWDYSSDYSGSSGYLAWDFVAGEVEDDDEVYTDDDLSDDALSGDGDEIEEEEVVEMWFYDGANGLDEGYDWPQSP